MRCRRCAGEQFVKAGRDRAGQQILSVRDVRAASHRPLHLGLPRLPLPRRHHRVRRALVSAVPVALRRYMDICRDD